MKKTAIISLMAGCCLCCDVSGATVTWNSGAITPEGTELSQLGTLVSAYNLGPNGGSVTVNGVEFLNQYLNSNSASGSFGSNITWARNGGSYFKSASSGGDMGLGNLSQDYFTNGDYQILLSTAYTTNAVGTTITFTLNDLVAGQEYLVQFWCQQDNAGGSESTTITMGDGTSSTYDTQTGYNTTNGNGAPVVVGTWITGTFTADSTSQAISMTFNNIQYSKVNAIQLRAIPEPAGAAFLTFAILPWLSKRRKRS